MAEPKIRFDVDLELGTGFEVLDNGCLVRIDIIFCPRLILR